MLSNETLAFRLEEDDDQFRVVCGILHTVFFPLLVLTAYVTTRKLYDMNQRNKATEGMRVVPLFVMCAGFYGVSSISSLAGGFSRSFLVVGDSTYKINQKGYLNSEATPWCKVSGVFMNFGANGMIVMSFSLVWNAYRLLTAPPRGRRVHSQANDFKSWRTLLKESPWKALLPFSFFCSIVSVSTTEYGPLALYCWIRCKENGIDAKYTNNSKCWMRLLTMYFWFFVIGLPTVFCAFKLMLHLKKNAPARSKHHAIHESPGIAKVAKRENAIAKAAKSIAIFTFLFGLVMAASFLIRIRSSIDPDPKAEGRATIVELLTSLIYPVGFYMFGLPNMNYLNCKWKAGEMVQSESQLTSHNSSTAEVGRRRLSSNADVDSSKQKGSPYVIDRKDTKADVDVKVVDHVITDKVSTSSETA